MKFAQIIEKQAGEQALAHHNTVFAQLIKLIPRHEFEVLAKTHHEGQRLRRMTRWDQFIALASAQLAGRASLRDIVVNLNAQAHKLYHVGAQVVSRASLARVNARQPHTLYAALFEKLLSRCQSRAPRHGFRFKNKLYALDASLIDLCLEVFPWAQYRKTSGAIKLHVGLDHGGHLPALVAVTEGKTHEIAWARTLALPAGSVVVFDRGFTDYAWYQQLHDQQIFFVTRQKTNARYTVTERHWVTGHAGLTSDQTIRLTGTKAQHCPIALRRIGYRDPETHQHYVFLTNNFKLAARTIAEIYKQRWQIELFFKWSKQNLKIKRFLGTSKNAVLTQLWIALCLYLLLAYLKFVSTLGHSLQHSLRLLQLNLFERRALLPLLRGDPPDTLHTINRAQLALL